MIETIIIICFGFGYLAGRLEGNYRCNKRVDQVSMDYDKALRRRGGK